MPRYYDRDNIYELGMNAYDGAYDRTQNLFNQHASQKAGRALASGDRAGAMAALGGVGDVNAVRSLQDDARREEADAYGRSRDEAADNRQKRQDQIQAGEHLLEASTLLGKLPEAQRWQVFSTHPLFRALIPDELRAQVKPEDLSDQGLRMFETEVKSQMVNLGGGGVGEYRPGVGGAKGKLEILREPDKPLILGNGATAFDNDGRVIARNPRSYAPPRASAGGAGLPPPPAGWRPR